MLDCIGFAKRFAIKLIFNTLRSSQQEMISILEIKVLMRNKIYETYKTLRVEILRWELNVE